MEDKFVRYSSLYLLVLLLFLAVPVTIGLIFGAFYGFAKLTSSGPGDVVYSLVIICLPSALFTAVYYIFFRRTGRHPSPLVRYISRTWFILAAAICIFFLALDIIGYFRVHSFDISGYYCFSLAFMAGNIGGLFLIAIMQAFTTEKEKDWLEKRKERLQ